MLFPPNVLTRIIYYTRPFTDTSEETWEVGQNFNFHLTLAAVSSHWRQAVLAIPNLWTTILFQDVRQAAAEKYAHYLQLCFERSGQLLLDLSISFTPDEWDYSPYLLSPESDMSILKNLDRIVDLRLRFPPYKWISMIPTVPNLTTLGISSPFDDVLSLPKYQTLEELYLRTPHREIRFQPSDQTITVLSFAKVPIDVCIKVLLGCPSLLKFSCTRAREPTDDFQYTLLKEPFKLRRLCHFKWEVPGASLISWNDTLLEHLRVPSLVTLTWVENDKSVWGPKTHLFFKHLPTTFSALRFIGISDASCRDNRVVDHIRYNTEVETIELTECGGELVKALFEKLL